MATSVTPGPVTETNVVQHVNKIYGLIKHLSDNHNKIVEHVKNMHKSLTGLKEIVTSAPGFSSTTEVRTGVKRDYSLQDVPK